MGNGNAINVPRAPALLTAARNTLTPSGTLTVRFYSRLFRSEGFLFAIFFILKVLSLVGWSQFALNRLVSFIACACDLQLSTSVLGSTAPLRTTKFSWRTWTGSGGGGSRPLISGVVLLRGATTLSFGATPSTRRRRRETDSRGGMETCSSEFFSLFLLSHSENGLLCSVGLWVVYFSNKPVGASFAPVKLGLLIFFFSLLWSLGLARLCSRFLTSCFLFVQARYCYCFALGRRPKRVHPLGEISRVLP